MLQKIFIKTLLFRLTRNNDYSTVSIRNPSASSKHSTWVKTESDNHYAISVYVLWENYSVEEKYIANKNKKLENITTNFSIQTIVFNWSLMGTLRNLVSPSKELSVGQKSSRVMLSMYIYRVEMTLYQNILNEPKQDRTCLKLAWHPVLRVKSRDSDFNSRKAKLPLDNMPHDAWHAVPIGISQDHNSCSSDPKFSWHLVPHGTGHGVLG